MSINNSESSSADRRFGRVSGAKSGCALRNGEDLPETATSAILKCYLLGGALASPVPPIRSQTIPNMETRCHQLITSVWSLGSCLALACLFALALTACGRTQKEASKDRPPIPVHMAEVIQKDTPFFLEAIGNAAAYNTVDVKSRVTGELVNRFFKAGDPLKEEQELFTIDPAPFQAKVREGEAKLRQSTVQYEQAKREYVRFKTLYAEKAVSQEQLETKEVDMNSKLYQRELNQAELETAKLNLGYCFIRAPLDGQSGEIYIDDFNIVNANQDKLVTIKQIKPIKVKFSIPGKYLDEIRKYGSNGAMEVEARPLGNDKPEIGSLSLVDNIINPKTGMIALEGTFANPEAKLWPGVFVRVRLKLTVTRSAVLVPERAVNEGPEGQYVWVANQEHAVAMRPVKLDRRDGDMAVLSEGLKPGEKVVTDGQLLLHPGAKVVPRPGAPPRKVEEQNQEKNIKSRGRES
ncbi:MAG: efflux RND transporter periplasmic adaptor subunit [Desulfomonile tiedjei]|uniref:Efflux RND transporter periplasmic adaptor subunit n=1 Tax=Desulfomonile tiedjei TaxID=2358 RepID=A0A9D6Z210_9BACT|nr:efflux RND transporter periplasmic adaptor subunit [Desulfomonile tiedjei]